MFCRTSNLCELKTEIKLEHLHSLGRLIEDAPESEDFMAKKIEVRPSKLFILTILFYLQIYISKYHGDEDYPLYDDENDDEEEEFDDDFLYRYHIFSGNFEIVVPHAVTDGIPFEFKMRWHETEELLVESKKGKKYMPIPEGETEN